MQINDKSIKEFEKRQKLQSKHWSLFYDFILFQRFFFKPTHKKIAEILTSVNGEHLKPGVKVLDVACGTGEAIYYLSKIFPHLKFTGIDFSKDMLKKAIQKNSAFSNVEFSCGDVNRLPFEDQAFDIVICSDSFHHFAEPERALHEINRVMKTKSLFLLADLAFDTIIQKIIFGLFGRIIERVKKYYSQKETVDLLEKSGFSINSVTTHWFNNFFLCSKIQDKISQ